MLALYFIDYFAFFESMSVAQAVQWAGAAAMLFGLMNVFARTLGGAAGDLFGRRWGVSGRVRWLFIALFAEGLALMFFSQMSAPETAHAGRRVGLGDVRPAGAVG